MLSSPISGEWKSLLSNFGGTSPEATETEVVTVADWGEEVSTIAVENWTIGGGGGEEEEEVSSIAVEDWTIEKEEEEEVWTIAVEDWTIGEE